MSIKVKNQNIQFKPRLSEEEEKKGKEQKLLLRLRLSCLQLLLLLQTSLIVLLLCCAYNIIIEPSHLMYCILKCRRSTGSQIFWS